MSVDIAESKNTFTGKRKRNICAADNYLSDHHTKMTTRTNRDSTLFMCDTMMHVKPNPLLKRVLG